MRNPIMVGERVYLRALEMTDAEPLARFDAEETDTFMYRGRQPQSPLGYESWLKDVYKVAPPPFVEFAVCLREDDRLIGSMGIGDLDWVNRTGETGSYLAAPFRNGGLGTEAKHLLLEYGFERLHLYAIMSTVFEANTRSSAALAKQGYQSAGRLRWHDVKGGVYQAMLVYDLLYDEWRAARDAWWANQANKQPTVTS
ncbi:MAG TPA: GNAT family protein [Thermomicrobiales bacterium]|jgi:RimJ/RimL family protein N-acetyltransferase